MVTTLMSTFRQSIERSRTKERARGTGFANATKNELGSNRNPPLGQIWGVNRNSSSSYLLGDFDMTGSVFRA